MLSLWSSDISWLPLCINSTERNLSDISYLNLLTINIGQVATTPSTKQSCEKKSTKGPKHVIHNFVAFEIACGGKLCENLLIIIHGSTILLYVNNKVAWNKTEMRKRIQTKYAKEQPHYYIHTYRYHYDSSYKRLNVQITESADLHRAQLTCYL